MTESLKEIDALYHIGYLAKDRRGPTKRNKDIADIADRLWARAEVGSVHLWQKRIKSGVYEYYWREAIR
jgi:hypothetical protein